jgi:O-acetyl-ADP-ribose deacetylase (regulator of RNase III)
MKVHAAVMDACPDTLLRESIQELVPRQRGPAMLEEMAQELELARGHAIDAIAFPAISCGVFGYPVAAAVAIAVREVRGRLERDLPPRRIVFCCFGAEIASAYRRELADETPRADP